MRAEGQGRLIAKVAASRTIFVAGAGIGGLTAALSLAAKGFRVVILEKAERLEEAGAGLQLSPNASRILVDLGLRPRLAPRAVTPEAINIMSARAGGEITRLPLGEAASLRAGAPYWVMHRADLQGALQAEVNDHPDIDLRLGCQFEDVTSHAKGLTVVQRRGNARQQELAVALIALPDLGEWTDGAIALLGDAAHAMLPFAAQGAGMAIEDAAVLAKALSESPGDNIVGIPAALKRYGRQRRGRVLRVQRAARQQGRIYHLTGPLALARDLAIKTMGPQRMLARQEWIYGWRV